MHRRVEFHPLPEGGIQVACNRWRPPRAAKDLPAGIAKNRTEPSRSPCRHPFTRDTAQNYRKKTVPLCCHRFRLRLAPPGHPHLYRRWMMHRGRSTRIPYKRNDAWQQKGSGCRRDIYPNSAYATTNRQPEQARLKTQPAVTATLSYRCAYPQKRVLPRSPRFPHR